MQSATVSGLPVIVHRSVSEAVDSVISANGRLSYEFAVSLAPETVIRAISDPQFMAAIKNATFVFADGIGVVWALQRKGFSFAVRVPGCEFWEMAMRRAGSFSIPVFLVGARKGVLDKVHDKLNNLYKVNVVGKQDGFFPESDEQKVFECVKKSGARIVTVAMGSPRQEYFINKCRNFYPDAFYLGVGGTYDVFSGDVKRAPSWACRLNVEWLYRLLLNPSRFDRQLVLFRFFWLLISKRL
jgi:UDP-N-acetyl-D-mannosaminouronate:lipid I N-acetyl-D-mannosaminouronosyltransferase